MKRRTLAIIVIVLVILAGLWFSRQQTVSPAENAAAEPAQTAELVLLDETQDQGAAQSPQISTAQDEDTPAPQQAAIDEYGTYTSKEDVSLYLYTYGRLPDNFITKDEARSLGWSGGGLDDYSYGKCIGGDRFGNYEGLLPEAYGRTYTECDVDTLHQSSRGAKRIVFSNDGLIYYTDDHYESFTLLYGEP